MVGPFVLLDHFGPTSLPAGEGVDIAPHAHAHMATLSYFFAGGTHHTDSSGNDVVVAAGDVAWMHAGAGIVHAERTPDAWRREGGLGHGLQAWVALPEALEQSEPRFQLARAADVPRAVRGGLTLRILVGTAFGERSPIETCSPVVVVEARADLAPGEVVLEPRGGRHAVLFVEGFGALDDHRVGVGTLVVLRDGSGPRLRLEAGTTALWLGGEPLGRRFVRGNVIASSEERLEAALRERG